MQKTQTFLTWLVIIGGIFLYGFFFQTQPEQAVGSAPSGLPARMASTSNATVGTTASVIFGTSTPACTARIITTAGKPITLTFSDRIGQTPTGSFGHAQLASTTVVYDSGQWGCDLVKAYGFDANTVITISEAY